MQLKGLENRNRKEEEDTNNESHHENSNNQNIHIKLEDRLAHQSLYTRSLHI